MIYWLWTKRGFFSEFSMLVLAEIYSDLHNKDIYIDSADSNLGFNNGIHDILETNNKPIKNWLARKISPYKKSYIISFFSKLSLFIQINKWVVLHNEVFENIWSKQFEDNIKVYYGDEYFHVISNYFINAWRVKASILKIVDQIKREIIGDDEYHAIHVRRGDKLNFEAELVNIEKYLENLNFNSVNKLYIATDDFSVIAEVGDYIKKNIKKNIKLVHLCSIEDQGYDQKKHNTKSKIQLTNETIKLITEIEILKNSNSFAGSFTSNIGRVIHLLRKGIKSHSVDIDFTIYYNPYDK